MIKPEDMQVVVLMGGLGTRLKEFTADKPKSLVEVEGKPFFDYQLDLMQLWGFRKFVFLIGYRANMIEDHYGDGSDRGISIQYCYDGEELLGTGGAVRRAYDLLEEDFILMYGDSFMDIDFDETLYRYDKGKQNGMQGLMTVLKNNNQFDKSNAVVRDGQLVLYDKHHPTPEMDYIDYGICIYEKQLFAGYQAGCKFDVAEVQHQLSVSGKMVAHVVTKRFYEIGSPASLAEFKGYVRRRLLEEHPAVFLDRDGVINEIVFNEDAEQMDSPLRISEFQLLPRAIEAIRMIREKGYYIFIVTNQPAAAKGKVSLTGLYDINTHFVNLLKEQGTEVDDIFMCPHFTKKLPMAKEEFLIQECDCRKPKPGLLYKAKRKYHLDWENSYMVGDSYTDVAAGQAAGVKTVFIGGFKCDTCKRLDGKQPDEIMKDIYAFAEYLPQA